MDNTPKTLAEIKSLIRTSLGTPQSNQNAATTLAGTTFFAENLKKEVVLATVLGTLSPKGKVQAKLACCAEDCAEEHVREQSDWHQSVRCPTHAGIKKAKLTDEEKAQRAVERAKAVIAKYAPQAA